MLKSTVRMVLLKDGAAKVIGNVMQCNGDQDIFSFIRNKTKQQMKEKRVNEIGSPWVCKMASYLPSGDVSFATFLALKPTS